MASSRLSDFSTCAERTLNVTGPQRTALIRLWEQRAMWREAGGFQEKASSHARFFTGPCIYSLTSAWCRKDTASFSVHCTAPHGSTHTHSTPLSQQEDQTSQRSWCIPVLTLQLGTTVAGIYRIYESSAEIRWVCVAQALSRPKVPAQISSINNLFLILIS